MTLPGFFATASIYRTSRHYRTTAGSGFDANSVQAALEIVIDGVPRGTVTGIDEIGGVIYFDPFFGGGPRGGGGGRGPPRPHQNCYTCELAGGVGICCYTINDSKCPVVLECVQSATRIIDECKDSGGSDAVCSRKGVCALIQCTERRLGPQRGSCTGIV